MQALGKGLSPPILAWPLPELKWPGWEILCTAVLFFPFPQMVCAPKTWGCQKRQWSIVGFLAVSRGRFVTCLNIGRSCHRGLGPGPPLVRSQCCGFRSCHGEKYSLKCEEERRKLINVRNIALEPLHGRCSGFSLTASPKLGNNFSYRQTCGQSQMGENHIWRPGSLEMKIFVGGNGTF